jgi:tetratricopeptide (TPR) repeat protein
VTQERLHHRQHILLLLLPVFLVTSCSTGKNTWRERTVQSLNTRFNVYFNGKKSYDEGLQAILQAGKDDYSTIIPMYPISIHANATAGSSQMTRAIEKTRKAIKTRSIKEKPKSNPKKRSDPKYRAFLQQEEFNPFMKEVWLLLAKSEFHKADFLGSVGTFNYIIRHFPNDIDLEMTCRLWVVRAYAEMGWIYEAEEMLRKLNPNDLRNENSGLFAAVQADLMLRQKQYKEAMPFLQLAVKWEQDKKMKMRFTFLMAQLHEKIGNRQESFDAYTRVLDANPPYEMDLNARINRAALFLQPTKEVRRQLQKMIDNNNNQDYLDQLYYTVGLSYLHDRDTANAVVNFGKAADESTRNGVEKATALIRMADVLYEQKRYVNAQPAYDGASKLLTPEHSEFARVSKRSELLSELVVEYEMVTLQDSLQRLSAMTPDQRLETIKAYIAWQQREEKLTAEREAKRLEKEANREPGLDPMAGMTPVGAPGQANAWYFYNTQALRTGQLEFQKRWGKRKLEDNWRRINKSAAMFAETSDAANGEASALPQDSLAATQVTPQEVSSDTATTTESDPGFYLKQIPETAAQLEKSNELWADALFRLGTIYKDKLEDYPMAIATFDEYVRRFGAKEPAPDALFNNYLVYQKLEQPLQAERVRERLLNSYPDARYAKLIADPDFLLKRQQMFEQQDSLYELTYKAFNANEFGRVQELTDTVRRRFPMSTLMPKFLFLKALSVAKTGDRDRFEAGLKALLDEFPQSEVSAMSKDMLALLRQGRESQQGSSHGSILARREAELAALAVNDSVKLGFSPDRKGPHRLILLSEASQEDLFPLQFQLAVYNFSKFLIKDFEITIAPVEGRLNGVSVYNFEDYAEAEWYLQSISEDESVKKQLGLLKTTPVLLSDFNYGLLRSGKKLNEYQQFLSTQEK